MPLTLTVRGICHKRGVYGTQETQNHRQGVGDLLQRRIGVEMRLEPAERELHRASPPLSVGTSIDRNP